MSALFLSALREGLWLLLLAVAPPLLAAALAGAAVELLQGRFAVREPATATLARLVVGLLVLALCAPWIGGQLLRLLGAVLTLLPQLGRS